MKRVSAINRHNTPDDIILRRLHPVYPTCAGYKIVHYVDVRKGEKREERARRNRDLFRLIRAAGIQIRFRRKIRRRTR